MFNDGTKVTSLDACERVRQFSPSVFVRVGQS